LFSNVIHGCFSSISSSIFEEIETTDLLICEVRPYLSSLKGMGLKDNLLYVTDIDRIHVIDKNKDRIIKTHDVSGAKILNDIAIDSKGNVYITDMFTKKVLILKNNKVDTWIDLNEYSKPNGLFMEEPDLLVGTADGLLRINLNKKDIKMEIPNKGGIDG